MPTTPMAIGIELVRRHGPLALIAGFLIYFLTNMLQATTEQTLKELRQHTTDSSWYQHQTCISMAVLAGTAKELCEPPRSDPSTR